MFSHHGVSFFSDKIGKIKEELSHKINDDFDECGTIGEDPKFSAEQMQAACKCVDALEGKTKQRLVTFFVKAQFKKYNTVSCTGI